MKININFAGRRYDQSEIPDVIQLDEGATLAELVTELKRQLPDDAELPASGLLAVNGEHAGHVASPAVRVLCDGDEMMIIAPVAGG